MSVYLAFDFGEKRIGAAVGDAITGTARALAALPAGDWDAIGRLLREWHPQTCIVGLPLTEDGAEQRITQRARAFAEELGRRQTAPVHLCDERYSSRAAMDELRAARASGRMARRVRKGDRDAEAARLILQQWLDEQRGTTKA
ncbi:MAG: Holliday junction resolvase RuvX [Gammaproteobacteria bacterium]|nr:Holliday junction resolvase RuvX [Gammaproteobacteria bacterium]